MKNSKYYKISIDTKEEVKFEKNDFIYNMIQSLCIKGYEKQDGKKIYLTEKQYNCIDRYAQNDGKRNFYMTFDKMFMISLCVGETKKGLYYYAYVKINKYGATNEEVYSNLNYYKNYKAV